MKKNNVILKRINKKNSFNRRSKIKKANIRNKTAKMDLEELDDMQMEVYEILTDNGYDEDEILKIIEYGNYTYYSDCNDLEDLGYAIVDLYGGLEDVPKKLLEDCFDYEKCGATLDAASIVLWGDNCALELY